MKSYVSIQSPHICQRNRVTAPTWSLHLVFLLAVAITADVVEGEEEVVFLVELCRQLYLYLKVRQTHSWGLRFFTLRKLCSGRDACRGFKRHEKQ